MFHKMKESILPLFETYRWWIFAQGVTILCCIGLFIVVNGEKTNNDQSIDDASNTLNATSEFIGSQEMNSTTKQISSQAKSDKTDSSPDVLFVDVKGAVCKPGIYPLEQDKRIKDALKLAGGTTDTADLKQVNQAQKVADEMVIYVPNKGEIIDASLFGADATTQVGEATNAKPSLININKASETDLMKLPGVGQKRAQDIIGYRETTPFQKIEDLGNVSGIGPKMLDKLMPLVQV